LRRMAGCDPARSEPGVFSRAVIAELFLQTQPGTPGSSTAPGHGRGRWSRPPAAQRHTGCFGKECQDSDGAP
jgi:hypothetical protein